MAGMPKNPAKENPTPGRKFSEGSKGTEGDADTLSILLKVFEDQKIPTQQQIEKAASLITQIKIKAHWKKAYLRAAGERTELETAADNASNHVESMIERLETSIEFIDKNQLRAREFAVNCFLYLNKVHEGTCLGDIGTKMIKLFQAGELSSEAMDELTSEAEAAATKSKRKFSNEPTPGQIRGIEFMSEEREERVAPLLPHLSTFQILSQSLKLWPPLLEALLREDTGAAQKIIDKMP
jgi:ribosome-associated translation inhibitor RaiA